MDYASITCQSHLDVLFPLHSVVESLGTDKFYTASKPPQISQEASERTEADPSHWSPLRLQPEHPDSFFCIRGRREHNRLWLFHCATDYSTFVYNAVSLLALIQCSSADSDSVSHISVLCTFSLPTLDHISPQTTCLWTYSLRKHVIMWPLTRERGFFMKKACYVHTWWNLQQHVSVPVHYSAHTSLERRISSLLDFNENKDSSCHHLCI